MKISKTLLAKYAQNKCTPEEKLFVENWLSAYETFENIDDEGEFKPFQEQTWEQIAEQAQFGNRKVISFSRTIIKYAAAACILFGAFIGGRVSANSSTGKTENVKNYEEHLYVSGGDKLNTHLAGDQFKIKYQGTLQLFNGSLKSQTIFVGDSTFIIKPGVFYHLMGSHQNPKLLSGLEIGVKDANVSDLSILRIDDK